MHLIAQTLLERETLELEQIKQLIEHGELLEPEEGGDEGNNGPTEPGEPIVDNIGDVRVRIQGKPEDGAPSVSNVPVGDIPNDVPNGSANDITSDPVVDTPDGTVNDLPDGNNPDGNDTDKGPDNGNNNPTV
ncbi:hypothetical protein D3C77_454270 [compost metagenome]